MSRRTRILALAAATAMAGLAATGVGTPTGRAAAAQAATAAPTAACGTPAAGEYRCLALYHHDTGGAGEPTGYGPPDLRAAYRLPPEGGPGSGPAAGQTVAIVSAYDNPAVEADLNAYRGQYGLPKCTTANGCFRKVNQRGDAGPLPDPSQGWGVETDLDVQMVSAACSTCRILLVEADEPSFDAMGTAVDTAVGLGAAVVSNSYGTAESAAMLDYLHHYDHPGHVITVASGDGGFGPANFPAVAGTVVAVGGTTLTRAHNLRGWTEQAWSGSASGCSAYIAKPAWQHDPNCQLRTVADVSAVADPVTGLAVYDSYLPDGEAGWQVVGGTSAAAPFIAGVFGLAHNPAEATAARLYQHARELFDVVGGSTGYCGDDYLCTGLPGYDGPTGLGTPDGTPAF